MNKRAGKIVLKIFYTILAILLHDITYAQSWNYVGDPGFSDSLSQFTSIALDPSGTPYVVFEDGQNNNKATVMKYNGSTWETVGSAGFSAGTAGLGFRSIAIDNSGTPYVVYSDGNDTGKATVMKYDGSSWITIGAPGFSAYQVSIPSISIDPGGTPYVAFQTMPHFNSPTPDPEGSVMKYNGSTWETVGGPSFVETKVYYTSIAIDASGTPYVAYMDYAHSGKATAKKYNGSSWDTVGRIGFSQGGAEYISIAIDTGGTPYVAYAGGVMKYSDTGWADVGHSTFPGTLDYTSLAIDGSGSPYVISQDYFPLTNKAVVIKYVDTSWVTVGSPGFSAGNAYYTAIAIDGSGTPYVVYSDCIYYAGLPPDTGGKVSVMKLGSPTEVKNITNENKASINVFPNPNTGAFSVNFTSPAKQDAQLIITDILGEEIKKMTITTNTETEVVLDVSTGVYFLIAITKNEALTTKIMVE